MKDLTLGDAHFTPIDDLMQRDVGSDMVAVVVVQRKESGGRMSGIKLSALSIGLQRVAKMARKKKASVHLPRIGHSTPNFNWYRTESLIRKYLTSREIPTFMYLLLKYILLDCSWNNKLKLDNFLTVFFFP